MQIDIISDPVCPWCYIAKRRLDKVLEMRPAIKTVINWRPFQLNPSVSTEGVDFMEYYITKFGGEQQAQSEINRIRAAGFEDGIQFEYELIKKSPNTLYAHCLMRLAKRNDVANQTVEALFKAYFLEGRDIGNLEVLKDIAVEMGMDGEEVYEDLDEGISSAFVQNELHAARQMGIDIVPCVIINQKYLITGVKKPFDLLQIIDNAYREENGASTPATAASPSANPTQP
jgi:predicted DsbA family dithiol-disulfide isomerase